MRELRRLGHRVVRRRGGAGRAGPLTAREREIAELVAAGRTNREIAEQLVLSTRTIEAHLRTIYAQARRPLAGRADPGGERVSTRFQRGDRSEVTTLELFYDLVFVFAVTQVSHLLLDHLTWEGAGQAALVLLVVWWSWNYTTWVTNELDPDAIPVRLLLIGLMLASLVMAVAIPEAFGDRGMLFAGAYVVIQVGRHTFLTFASGRPGTIERTRAGEILIWFLAAGVLWLGGALVEGRPARCSGSSRWPSTTAARSSSTASPASRGSTTSRGRWTAATSPSASSCS